MTNSAKSEPLLTIAIPTFNRAPFLHKLLWELSKQYTPSCSVTIVVSDNASADDTEDIVRQAAERGLPITYIKNATNLGPDGNILQCFMRATSKYVWIFGDDDILLPGALRRILYLLAEKDYDLVFIAPFAFHNDPVKEFATVKRPSWRQPTRELSNPFRFVRFVNRHADLIFISSMIIDKRKIPITAIARFPVLLGSNLVQLGWVISALNHFCRGLLIEPGLLASKAENSSGGFDAVEVFGKNYNFAVREWTSNNSRLQSLLINEHLVLWFSGNWASVSKGSNNITAASPDIILTPLFGRNFRYWLFVYPLFKLPIPLAKLWGRLVRKVARWCLV
jgi:abequosyltransferase